MRLDQLLTSLPDVIAVSGKPDVHVDDITADSRRVVPGALFVAYRGVSSDGHHFVPEALARGAVAVVGEQPSPDPPVPYVQVADGRAALAWLSAAWHGYPSNVMAVVGITGTDGKTTTANLLASILETAGRRVGLISTVHAVIGRQVYDTGLHTTTPDAPEMQRYLAQMRDAGIETAVLEVTSHGLAQHRVTGCAFDIAVITNITHEHLDFHGSYEAYRDAKAALFRALMRSPHKPGLPKTAVLNRDDTSFDFLARVPAERTITYGISDFKSSGLWLPGQGRSVAVRATNIRHTPSGIEFAIEVGSDTPAVVPGTWSVTTPLVGQFNVYNILAAISAALALRLDAATIRTGVRAVAAIPGRMERVDRGQTFTAIVDFAHTPNALGRALETARALAAPDGRVIAVFGSAGLRDRAKRYMMGEVAAYQADMSIITAEDPRTEDLEAIMAETASALVAAGRTEGDDFIQVADRQRAILYAVRQAQAGDVVIVCGKGHEQSMCFGTTEYPWRDQEALAWALDTKLGRPVRAPFFLPTWNLE